MRVGGKSPISRLRNRQEIAVEPPRPRETRSRAALAGPGHFACGFLGCSVPFIFIKACFLLLLQTQSQDEFSACSSGPAAPQAPLPQRTFHSTSQLLIYCVHLHQWRVGPQAQAPLSDSFPPGLWCITQELLTKNAMNEQVHKPRRNIFFTGLVATTHFFFSSALLFCLGFFVVVVYFLIGV